MSILSKTTSNWSGWTNNHNTATLMFLPQCYQLFLFLPRLPSVLQSSFPDLLWFPCFLLLQPEQYYTCTTKSIKSNFKYFRKTCYQVKLGNRRHEMYITNLMRTTAFRNQCQWLKPEWYILLAKWYKLFIEISCQNDIKRLLMWISHHNTYYPVKPLLKR